MSAFELLPLTHDVTRALYKQQTGGGKRRRPMTSIKYHFTALAFHCGDLQAHRGIRQIQLSCGFSKAAMLCDSDQCIQRVYVHVVVGEPFYQ